MHAVELFCGPNWFSGIDLVIDFFSILVLVLITIYVFKAYKLHKNLKFKSLGWAMLIMSVSFIMKIITYGIFYLRKIFSLSYKNIGNLNHGFVCTDNSFILIFTIYALINVLGLFALLMVYKKDKSFSTITLFLYLLIISLIFTTSVYYMFHLTSLVLLILVTITFCSKYFKNKLATTKLLCYSFGTLAISNILFLIVSLSSLIYVFAEIVQLIGFLGILITFIMVLNNGKKTRKIRHN